MHLIEQFNRIDQVIFVILLPEINVSKNGTEYVNYIRLSQ